MYPERHPNRDRSPDALEARLRALPPPPVPAGLEARLLAAMPVQAHLSPSAGGEGRVRGHRPLWSAAACALAAACLLAVLLWREREVHNPIPDRPPIQAERQDTPLDESASRRALLQARRDLDEAKIPTFAWPLEETSSMRLSISIPYELPN